MGHHYVPQRYLRNFEDPKSPGLLWLHDKRDVVARPAAIRSVAQAKGYYSPESEKRLAGEVEIPGNRVIAKLIEGCNISECERLRLAFYIGTMFKRVPRSRRKVIEMLPDVLREVVESVKREFNSLADEVKADPELVAKRLREIDALHARYSIEAPQSVLDQANEPWPSERVVHTVFSMSWRILESTGPQYFITSDNPAFFFEGFGLANEKAELTFPLASTHALHGSWQGSRAGLRFLTANQKFVREINRRLASGTERLSFYHERAPWLLQILPKKDPYLSRFVW